jgi:hypothetical protein
VTAGTIPATIPHRRGIDELIGIRPINILGRVLLHPPAEDWGAAMVAGHRCSVFGIAAVDATVRTNLVIATAPFTGAFGQQDFIDRDHISPEISISMENDNARGRQRQTAGVTLASHFRVSPAIKNNFHR